MELTIKTDKIKILEDFFENLGTMDQRKIFTAGFKKGAKPMIATAKAGIKDRSGNLRKSIGSAMLFNTSAIIVGARKFGGHKGYHGHLIENGTETRFRKSGGATGKSEGTHFFETAYDLTKDKMFDSVQQEWYDSIERFIVSTNKRLK